MSAAVSASGYRRGLLLISSGSAVNLVLLFLELLVVARLLPTSAYGSYILLVAAVNFLVMATDFGCKLAVTRLISSEDHERQQAVVGTALAFRVAVLVSASALILLFRGVFAYFNPSSNLSQYLVYAPIMLATASLDEILFSMLQGFRAYRPMAVAQIGRAFLRIVLTASLLIAFHPSVAVLVGSWSISFAVAIIYQYQALPVKRVWGPRREILLEILRFGAPLQITRFLGFVADRLHIVLLGALAGVDVVAYFAVANKIPDALQTLGDSYFRVYFPTMTSLLSSGQRRAADLMLQRSVRLIGFGSALAAVAATVFRHEIVVLLFSAKYSQSAAAFALLMIALHVTVVVNVLGYTLTAAGRPGRALGMDVVQMVVSAAGDLVMIPSLGLVGAAFAAIVGSYASTPLGAWLIRRSQLTMPAACYVKQTLILALCAAVGWWVHPPNAIAGLIFKGAIVASFIVLSLLSAAITRDDFALFVGKQGRDDWPARSSHGDRLDMAEGTVRS